MARGAICLFVLCIATAVLQPLPAEAQITERREIDVGFVDFEAVRPVIEERLSPVGRFVLLTAKGSVLVIDDPANLDAVEIALAEADLPGTEVALDFQFRTGLPSRRTRITVGSEIPLPAAYRPPTIFVGPNGPVAVVPAHPTRFVRREVGTSSEVASTINPDGSLTLDIDTEHSELEGFVNYGSAILPADAVGTVPVRERVGDPTFFRPFLNSGDILLPIVRTTRISTSVVVRPRVSAGKIAVDMMPRLTVHPQEAGVEEEIVDLKEFRTTLEMSNGQAGRANGFRLAGEDFNRQFLGAKDPENGGTAIVVKATARAAPECEGEGNELPETEQTRTNADEAED